MKLKFSLILLVSNLLFAQNSAVTNASIHRESGEFKEAKTEIDKAILHEKTMNEPKTWYYRGLIYAGIFNSDKPEILMLSDSSNLVALNSFKRAIKLENKERGTYTKLSNEQLENLWSTSINEGIKKYDAKDFKKAKANFEVAYGAKPTDSIAFNNIFAACQQLRDTICILNHYKKIVDSGREKSEYYFLSYAYNLKKDTALALSFLEQGLLKFPNNKAFKIDYVVELFAAKQYEKVLPHLEALVKEEPNNKAYRNKLAVTYEDLGKFDQAIDQYNELLKIDPSNVYVMYNNGVLKYKKALKFSEQKDLLKSGERAVKGKELDDKYKKTLYESADNFEAYRKIRPKDSQVNKTLIDIYKRLKRDDMIEIVRKEQ